MNGVPRRHRLTPFAVLVVAAIAAGVAAVVLGAFVAPPDAVQGDAQRLMYLHVPAAWSAYLCFAVVLLAGVGVLLTRSERADRAARAAAEVGLVLTMCTLATGSLWGGLTWGTWWAWDARVLSTVAMGLVYAIYLSARALTDDDGRAGVAILGIAGFAIVPVVHFSVLWWRTLHQPPTLLAPSSAPPIDPLMLVALLSSVAAFTLAVWVVLLLRTRVLSHRAPEAIPAHRTAAAVAAHR